jgi:type II secretory pathway pseudopilin PulG
MTAEPREQGFALAETLVAAAIVAGMTALLYQCIASNARATQLVAQSRTAMSLAQSALAQATTSVPPAEFLELRGPDGFVAAISVSPYNDNARSDGPPLEQVVVTVRLQPESKPLLRLESLRLKR